MKSRTLTTAGLGAAAAAALTPVALPAAAVAAAKAKTYKGAVSRTQYSDVQVTITVIGKRIKTISVSANPSDQASYQRQSYALPLLRQEALKANSYKIHAISGVTITSQGFDASLYSAMHYAKLV